MKLEGEKTFLPSRRQQRPASAPAGPGRGYRLGRSRPPGKPAAPRAPVPPPTGPSAPSTSQSGDHEGARRCGGRVGSGPAAGAHRDLEGSNAPGARTAPLTRASAGRTPGLGRSVKAPYGALGRPAARGGKLQCRATQNLTSPQLWAGGRPWGARAPSLPAFARLPVQQTSSGRTESRRPATVVPQVSVSVPQLAQAHSPQTHPSYR